MPELYLLDYECYCPIFSYLPSIVSLDCLRSSVPIVGSVVKVRLRFVSTASSLRLVVSFLYASFRLFFRIAR